MGPIISKKKYRVNYFVNFITEMARGYPQPGIDTK
jgi:hypothetical protein